MKTVAAILATALSIGTASAQYLIGRTPTYSPPTTGQPAHARDLVRGLRRNDEECRQADTAGNVA
jgi:hypothetical protein